MNVAVDDRRSFEVIIFTSKLDLLENQCMQNASIIISLFTNMYVTTTLLKRERRCHALH